VVISGNSGNHRLSSLVLRSSPDAQTIRTNP
jgi:hypothetical protein